MQFVIKNKSVTDFFAEVADAYYAVCPARAAEFDEGVAAHQYGLKKPTGMSDEGNFMSLGLLPEHLYTFIIRAARTYLDIDDIFRDKKNFYLFFKVWKKAATRRKPTQILRVSNFR